MTDLSPIEYLDEAAKVFDYRSWQHSVDWFGNPHSITCTCIIAHARALHQLAQARAEIAALKPRETLEDVARREAIRSDMWHKDRTSNYVAGFLRGVQMQKEGVLPDE